MRSEELLKQYLFFGDDPFVQVPQGTPVVRFSARDYARERVAAVCGSDTK